jgi:hypothetical protein
LVSYRENSHINEDVPNKNEKTKENKAKLCIKSGSLGKNVI